MSFMEIKRFVNSGNTPLNNYIDKEIKNKINSDEDKALDVIIRELCKKPFYFTGFVSETRDGYPQVSTLPYNFYDGSAVVYNNEIHILGGSSDTNRYHYKWNGSSWVSASTLPYNFCSGSAVVYNNEIHILGGSSGYTKHYKWNGSSWVSVSTLPYSFYYGSAVVCNNEIHILGGFNGSSGVTTHLRYDRITNAKHAYLLSGMEIHLLDISPVDIIPISNCTKQDDGTLIVQSDGVVYFGLYKIDTINYTIA